ncbi:MAG: porin family protein [Chlorobi bacterium]|nr:porin family protein [Chlorobiota bacterium]
MKKALFTIILIITTAFSQANAQDEIIDFLNAGIEDANALGHEYLRPYGEMLGVSLNGAWYSTAKVHKVLGFDVTFSASYVTVPGSGKSFDTNNITLQNVSPTNGTTVPTMAGSKSQEQSFYFNDDPTQSEILTIKGSDLDYFVSPMVQASVGVPFHSEIIVRYMPKVSISDYGKVSLWGLGVKHSLKDYIPFVKHVPALQLSVLGAYTNFSSNLGVEYNGSSGDLDINANAYSARVLVGFNVPVISVYAGAGYGNTSSDFDVKGTFTGIPGEIGTVTDPISLGYTTNGFDFNVGMRIRLAIFAIYADYTVGDYSVITGGVGFSFR